MEWTYPQRSSHTVCLEGVVTQPSLPKKNEKIPRSAHPDLSNSDNDLIIMWSLQLP